MFPYHVIEVDFTGHGPEFDANATNRCHPKGLGVVEVIWVGDLPWLPLALVVGVVDQGCMPFALVQRIIDHRYVPLATSRGCYTGGVGN